MDITGWTLDAPSASSIDEAEVRRAVALLVDPVHAVMVQRLPGGRWEYRVGADADGILEAVRDLAGGKGVYLTLNPLPSGLEHAARSADVLARRWLMVDVDPAKHEEDYSATDAEKAAAQALAGRIRADLSARDWPEPVVVDSGNGTYLLYRIDLPNDPLAQVLLREVLKALAAKFDGRDGKVDVKVHDAKRIAKVPGTMARKGPDLPDRPHRMARLLSVPDPIAIVPVDRLKLLAGLSTRVDHGPVPATPRSSGEPGYARAALEGELGKVIRAASAAQGGEGRNNTLYEAALKLGGYVAAGHLDPGEVARALEAAGRAVGLATDGDPGEIDRAIKNGLATGMQTPKAIPERKAERNGRHEGPAPIPPGTRLTVRASEITPRRVEWLWGGRIPLGKLTTFAGWGGLGKTFVLLDIAARVSRGDEWPEPGGECAEPGRVLFVSGEDEPDDTLVPRLIELGADLDRVSFLTTESLDRFTLADLELLNRSLDEVGPEVRFVAIDPPTAYLGGVDDHKNSELRALLSPLKNLAARRRIALVFNTHVNKATGRNVEAMARVMSSVAWVNAVRAAHIFALDPEDPGRVLFVPMKANLSAKKMGLAYRVVPTDGLARIEWLGTVGTTADEAINQEKRKPAKVEAADLLVQMFGRQLQWPGDQFWAEVNQAGISKRTLLEAKAGLGIPRPRRTVGADGDATYIWWVPQDWPHLPETASRTPAHLPQDEAPF